NPEPWRQLTIAPSERFNPRLRSSRGKFCQAIICLGNAEILGALVPSPGYRRIGLELEVAELRGTTRIIQGAGGQCGTAGAELRRLLQHEPCLAGFAAAQVE